MCEWKLDQEALVAVAKLLTLRPVSTKTSLSLRKPENSKSQNRTKVKAPDHNIGMMRSWMGGWGPADPWVSVGRLQLS